MTVYTDASTTGWGACSSTDRIFSGIWTPAQAQLHINQLELIAVQFTVENLPQNTSILIMSYNKTSVAAIN